MAYISGYEYDIFISYAHDDNEVPEGNTGWVTQFHDYLENWLTKRRQLKGLKIWFDDDKLHGNTAFDSAIKKNIEKSALFFVIHSGNYQDSEYCRKELDWFLKHNNKLPNGVMVGDDSRIFNILINNIHYKEWPDALEGTSGFPLHDADNEEDFGYPTSPGKELFDQQMHQIVDAIANILETMPKSSEQKKSESEPAESASKIFIADVADTLQPFRKRLISEISDKATVLPAMPPPYEVDEHKRKLAETLQQASLTIHMLDQWPGRLIDGTENISFPRLQADTVRSSNNNSLVWVPDTLKDKDIEDQQQAVWLKEMENGARESTQFHFVRSSPQSFINQVKQVIDELQLSTTQLNGHSRFLIDTHQKDQRFAYKVADILSDKGIDVDFNKEARDPVKSLDNFEDAVRDVQNLIIMFGGVAPNWLKGRIQTAVKIVAEQFQTGSPMLDTIWVLLLPKNPGMESIGQLPPLIRINCIENSASDTIDDSVIDRLLKKQGGQ